eukprot:310906-Chlamydomonas_euryale.AAC.1
MIAQPARGCERGVGIVSRVGAPAHLGVIVGCEQGVGLVPRVGAPAHLGVVVWCERGVGLVSRVGAPPVRQQHARCVYLGRRVARPLVVRHEPHMVAATAAVPVREVCAYPVARLQHHVGHMHDARPRRRVPPWVVRPAVHWEDEAGGIDWHVEEVGLLRVK